MGKERSGDRKKIEMNFSFLDDVSFEDLVGGIHLFNHIADHRISPQIKPEEIALYLDSSQEQLEISKKIISEVEKFGKDDYRKVSQEIINKAILSVSNFIDIRLKNYLNREYTPST